jgi:hypothetical protein
VSRWEGVIFFEVGGWVGDGDGERGGHLLVDHR